MALPSCNIYHLNIEQLSDAQKRWHWCYLHGQAEQLNYTDVFVSDENKPTETGTFAGVLDGRPVIIVMAENADGVLEGLVAYVEDTEALKHCLNTDEWCKDVRTI